MKKFLKEFDNEYAEKHINLPLARRELEPPLFEFVLDVFKSIEKTGYVTLINWEHITDESKIEPSKYIVTRKKKGKNKDKQQKFINTHYDRCTLLNMAFRIEVKGETAYKNVSLLLPKADANNFLCLKGKSVYLLYQLVNNSTYVTKNSVIMKGMMPLCINRQSCELIDSNLGKHKVPKYKILNFKKEFNPLILFAAKMGIYHALAMFGVDKALKIVNINEPEKEKWTYFIIQNTTVGSKKKRDTKVKLAVATDLFEKYNYLRAMTGMAFEVLCDSAKPDTEKIGLRTFWLDELGFLYTQDRNTSRDIGRSTLVFWERLIDATNKKILKMFDYNKRNIYNLTATLIQNFDEFKKKDNNDINNKRLRLNECIGALTSLRVGKSVNRILSKGDKVTLDEVCGMMNIAPNLIFRLLYASPLITYNDIVNDMDFFNAYKYTIKGPNAIGKNSERKVTARDRGVPLSSIGKIDADVCSSSSPGLGGLVSPFAKTYGLHFSDKMESQDAAFEMIKAAEKYNDANVYIEIPEKYEDYVKQLEVLDQKQREFINIKPKEDIIYITIDDFDDTIILS